MNTTDPEILHYLESIEGYVTKLQTKLKLLEAEKALRNQKLEAINKEKEWKRQVDLVSAREFAKRRKLEYAKRDAVLEEYEWWHNAYRPSLVPISTALTRLFIYPETRPNEALFITWAKSGKVTTFDNFTKVDVSLAAEQLQEDIRDRNDQARRNNNRRKRTTRVSANRCNFLRLQAQEAPTYL